MINMFLWLFKYVKIPAFVHVIINIVIDSKWNDEMTAVDREFCLIAPVIIVNCAFLCSPFLRLEYSLVILIISRPTKMSSRSLIKWLKYVH